MPHSQPTLVLVASHFDLPDVRELRQHSELRGRVHVVLVVEAKLPRAVRPPDLHIALHIQHQVVVLAALHAIWLYIHAVLLQRDLVYQGVLSLKGLFRLDSALSLIVPAPRLNLAAHRGSQRVALAHRKVLELGLLFEAVLKQLFVQFGPQWIVHKRDIHQRFEVYYERKEVGFVREH